MPQFTEFADTVKVMEGVKFNKPIDVQLSYIPKIELDDIEACWRDGVKLEDASDVFIDVANHKGFVAITDSMQFKKAVHIKFTGGCFAKIKTANKGDIMGTLWLAPAFNLSDLLRYYDSMRALDATSHTANWTSALKPSVPSLLLLPFSVSCGY